MKQTLLTCAVLLLLAGCANQKSTLKQQGKLANPTVVVDSETGNKTIECAELPVFKSGKTSLAVKLTGFPAQEWQKKGNEFRFALRLKNRTWYVGKSCFVEVDGNEIKLPLTWEKPASHKGKDKRYSAHEYDYVYRCKEGDHLIQALEEAHDFRIQLEVCNRPPPYEDSSFPSYNKRDAKAVGLETFRIERNSDFYFPNGTLATGMINEKGEMMVHTFASGSVLGSKGLELKPPYKIWGTTRYHPVAPQMLEQLQKVIKMTREFQRET